MLVELRVGQDPRENQRRCPSRRFGRTFEREGTRSLEPRPISIVPFYIPRPPVSRTFSWPIRPEGGNFVPFFFFSTADRLHHVGAFPPHRGFQPLFSRLVCPVKPPGHRYRLAVSSRLAQSGRMVIKSASSAGIRRMLGTLETIIERVYRLPMGIARAASKRWLRLIVRETNFGYRA